MRRIPPNVTNLPPGVAQDALNRWSAANAVQPQDFTRPVLPGSGLPNGQIPRVIAIAGRCIGAAIAAYFLLKFGLFLFLVGSW